MLTESLRKEIQSIIDIYKLDIKYINDKQFIKKFKDNEAWISISYYQKLSEEFIREFQDEVYWYNISSQQTLSKSFIREFRNKLSIKYLLFNGNIDKETKDLIKVFL